MSDFLTVEHGRSPLVLSVPHAGTELPDEVAARLNDLGRAVPDTDWWMDRLYDFAAPLRPSVVRTRISRYVIDVNRDPEGASLYPGQATTELCPTTTFDGAPIYRGTQVPDGDEIARRRRAYFDPYHTALAAALDAARQRHGYAVLYDCHSIRSVVPRLFAGELPVLNLGTNDGRSCAPEIEAAAVAEATASGVSFVANGRFRGGFITRRHGRPGERVHALQMELAQRAYMEERPPWPYDEARAARIRPVLSSIIEGMMEAAARCEAGR